MGVWIYPNIVKKEDNKIIKIEDTDMPKANQIYHLSEIIDMDHIRRKLIQISNPNLDLSFFTKANSSDYGNNEYENLTFSPSNVIETIDYISQTFEINKSKLISPIVEFEGVFDKNNIKLKEVFVEKTKGFSFFKKSEYKLGNIIADDDKAIIRVFDENGNILYKEEVDLTKEKPNLYYVDTKSKLRKDKIDWEIRTINVYDKIKPELKNIKELAEYAKKKNYELQITHS